MLMFIIGMSLLFSYVMSYLHISQSAAEWIVAMHLSKWLLLAMILLMVIVLGFFLPPVSHHPDDGADHPAAAEGRRLRPDLVRRVMTIVMEMGLIHPPVGLNIFVIKNIAPDIPLSRRDLGRAALRRPDVASPSAALRVPAASPRCLPDLVMGAAS